MIAQSCGLCRQGVFLLLLMLQTGRGSSIKKTFVFHFLPWLLTDLAYQMFPSLMQKGSVVLLAEVFLVCQPTAGLTLNVQEKESKGCKLFFFGSAYFQKWCWNQLGCPLTCGFCWQLSQKWLHSLCPYMLNILWRCVQLTLCKT